MKRLQIGLLLFLGLTAGCSHSGRSVAGRGVLMIVGGKEKPAAAVKRFIEYVADRPILVIPSASAVPLESGPDGVELFRRHGARNVDWLFIDGPGMACADSVVEKIENSGGVFFTGGVQTRLMDRIGGTRAEEAIRRLYFEERGVIGGTSAGAAVQSSIMITGDGDFTVLRRDNIKTERGLGLLSDCIIDQHFVARRRNNRLVSLVIEKNLPGIGIDESTAIIYYPDDTFEVYGEGSVVVYDPRKSRIHESGGDSLLLSAEGLRMSVLRAGQSFDLIRGRIIPGSKYHPGN